MGISLLQQLKKEALFLSKAFCMLIFSRALWTRNHTGTVESEDWNPCECVRAWSPVWSARWVLCSSGSMQGHAMLVPPTPMAVGLWHLQNVLWLLQKRYGRWHVLALIGRTFVKAPSFSSWQALGLRLSSSRRSLILWSVLAGWRSHVSSGRLLWAVTGRMGVRYVIK